MRMKANDNDGHAITSPASALELSVPYVSVWDGGVTVETTAVVNIKTGEVKNIATADISGLDICEREYIVLNDEQVNVYQDEHGYDYWADIQNEYL